MIESRFGPSADFNRPSPARMYDYYLGGAHNFAVDREAAESAIASMPYTTTGAQVNRSWLGRAVRFLIRSGVRQFLDLGSGVPTVGNVHEIAQRHDPGARVVYVDVDPVATAHTNQLLEGNERATVVQADLRDINKVTAGAGELLDWTRPVAVLACAVLHFVPEYDDPAGLLAAYRTHLVPGSYVALSHIAPNGLPNEEVARFTQVYQHTTQPVVLRERSQIEPLLAGLTLVEPGLVRVPLWRPDDSTTTTDAEFPGYAAIGHKD